MELKDKLLNNAVDKKAKKRVEKFLKEGEVYGKYDVTLEEAEEFRFKVYKGDWTVRVKYEPRDPNEFDRVVMLLKEIGLSEGYFTAEQPEGGGRAE